MKDAIQCQEHQADVAEIDSDKVLDMAPYLAVFWYEVSAHIISSPGYIQQHKPYLDTITFSLLDKQVSKWKLNASADINLENHY
ncbi:uncharacterized protein G2W53_023596 [Senna tora]|uniref:Uncharacterized protein n=1 Tax=Senna tora TaxID=362788 RepID=A0A834TAS2_9FABA|nr:uncharacterized protein G2W53_023596 [Senna tora]